MFADEMREWVASLTEERDPAITGEDALRVLEVMDAVVESSHQRAPVELG
jgi:predicted dehydrogenase